MRKQRPNQLLNLSVNVLIPVFIMTRLSGVDQLGPIVSLVIAVLFPITYGIYRWHADRQLNFFSAIGLTSVILTGTIGILHLGPGWIALKETAIPLIVGLAILISQRTQYPLLRTFLGEIINLPKIDAAFKKIGRVGEFEKNLTHASYVLGVTYFLSAVLNYVLAVVIVTSPPGTPEYTQEIGYMTGISYPVIALPMMLITGAGMFWLIYTIKHHTQLDLEDIVYS